MKGLIFTYCLTYGGALVSFLDPFTGLLVYICFAILKPDYLWFSDGRPTVLEGGSSARRAVFSCAWWDTGAGPSSAR